MKKYLTNKYIIMIIVILLSGLSVGTIILISKNDSKKENLPIEDNKKTNIKDEQSNNDKSDDEKVSEAENKNKDEISDTISDKNDADKNANNNINSNNSETSSSQNKNNDNGSNNNNNKTNNNDQTPNKVNNVPQPSPSPKPTSSTSPTSKPSSSPTPTVTPTTSPSAIPTPSESPSAKTQAEKNDEYRKQIQDKYSVSIAYKDELGDYYMNGYPRPVKQTDDSTIYSYLQRIENVLNKYPTNFFKEIKNTRMNLTIYMVKSIDIGVAGLTNSSNRSNVIIMINTISITSFETTLHHEIMHFIDSYISFNLGSGVIENSMVSVNPSGFTYGSSDSSYVYDYYNASTASTAYFLSNYSKTNYLEDRAVIFASLMTSTMKYPYLNNGTPIYKKARLISNQLRDNFNSVKNSSNLYWERLLK
ncbi:MAG: hypothetical protein MRZ42_00170 [Tenericutes bacterium]|nr:hypothetical protein [Mycoplasmatota bacterium]